MEGPPQQPVSGPVTSLTPTLPVVESFQIEGGEPVSYDSALCLKWQVSGSAGVMYYRAAESPGFPGAAWQATTVQSNAPCSASFVLDPPTAGSHTVYVQFKNDAGQSDAVSDSIVYELPEPIGLNSFAINNNAAHTLNRQVSLHHDAVGYTPTHYRACESCDLASENRPWKPYQSTPEFELSADEGEKTVYLQVKGPPMVVSNAPVNESAVRSDEIEFFEGERCFGAVGLECGQPPPNVPDALCLGNACLINAGSWKHDECCWEQKVSGSGKSCISFALNTPAEVCADSWAKAWNRVTFGQSWRRTLNLSKRSTTGEVVFDEYCAEPGARLHKDDAWFCCDKKGVSMPSTPAPNPNTRVCN